MGMCVSPRRVILSWLLVQQQDISLYLLWISVLPSSLLWRVLTEAGWDASTLLHLHLFGTLDCIMWGRLDTPTVFHPASSNCIFPSKFCAIIFLLPIMFWFMSKILILCHILTKEDFWIVFGSCREHKYVVGRELSRYLPSKWFFLHYFFLFSSF